MIMRSTQPIEAITRTEMTTDIVASRPQSRRKNGLFGISTTRKGGAKFTAPRGMIWENARFFWIGRRCHH
jgi:hypothetical protein